MSRNGYKVMDSDMHVVEPSDLFERCLDARFDAPHRSSSYGNCTRRGVRGSRCWTALVATTAARASDWRCSLGAAGAARGVAAKRRA